MSYQTIRFDLEDRLNPAPGFQLHSANGKEISFAELYPQGSLVLMFLHTPDEPACRQFLSAVISNIAAYQHLDAQVIAIFQCPAADLPESVAEPAITLLSDPHKSVRQAYASLMAPELVKENDVMLFALDSFGGIYTCLISAEPDALAQEELFNWLDYIGIQCPE